MDEWGNIRLIIMNNLLYVANKNTLTLVFSVLFILDIYTTIN